MYWEQSLPEVIDLSAGEPPCLNQMVYQNIAKTPSDITPWSWPELLSLSMVKWDTEAGGKKTTHEAVRYETPMRLVRIDPQIRAGTGDLQVSERFRAIAEVLSRPIGDFQANRFFTFPAMIDTRAISVLVEAVRSSTGTLGDEAAYIRCMLLSELVMQPNKVPKVTHMATRAAIDVKPHAYGRQVGDYCLNTPNGRIAAVDLTYFAQLLTRKMNMTQTRARDFGVDTWGSVTAVVPIFMEYSGSSALTPYGLSFVSSLYWNQRVGYYISVSSIDDDTKCDFDLYCVHRAGQVVVGGPTNILFVVLDIEVHADDQVSLEVGSTKVQILGRSTKRVSPDTIYVRTILDGWLGKEKTVGTAPGRQRDAYEALEILNRMVGTAGVYDAALNIVTEATRTFYCGAGVNTEHRESYGIGCVTSRASQGKSFGQGGPKVKQLGPWDDRARINEEFDYIRWYFISPSGMLCEGVGNIKNGGIWPSLDKLNCTSYSLSASEADYEIRMARALELIMPGSPPIHPRKDMSLTYWLSGNAVLMAGVTYGAYLSFGLDWAMLNGLVTMNSDITSSVKSVVPLITNKRVQNCVDMKRKMYLTGKDWDYGKTTQKFSSDASVRLLKDVNSFPLPMYMVKAVMGKLGVVLKRPDVTRTYFDFEEDDDSAPLGVIVPSQRNWLFTPWVCDSIDFVRNKFSVITNAPAGKDEKIAEVAVWPYAWADNISCWGSDDCAIDMATRIRLTTNAMSGRFYSEAFLKRETFVYISNTAAAGTPEGEPHIDLTLPDPAVGFWQKAWEFLKGWVPKVISDVAPHVLSGNLPGVAFEVARNVAEPVLDWLKTRKEEKEATEYIDKMGHGTGGPGDVADNPALTKTPTTSSRETTPALSTKVLPPAPQLTSTTVPSPVAGATPFESVNSGGAPSE